MEKIKHIESNFTAEQLLREILREGEWIPIDGPTTCKIYMWSISNKLKCKISDFLTKKEEENDIKI